MKQNLSEYKNLYIETARVYLNHMLLNISIMEKEPQNKFKINNNYISAHSLKSQSEVMGFSEMVKVCDILERLFHDIKEGIVSVDPNLLQVLKQTVKRLQEDVNRIEKEGLEYDLSNEVLALENATNGHSV